MNSSIYRGWVRHRRFAPEMHEFRYRLFMLLLDLDELDQVNRIGRWFACERRAPMSFYRGDHWGNPARALKEEVLDLLQSETGKRSQGPVLLLTQPRCWGYCFNPISVFYCFEAGNGGLAAVVAEVTNTPWGERHCYVIPTADGATAASGWFDKAMRVSPFMPIDQRYRWRGKAPGRALAIHLENHEGDARLLDATLTLRREPLNAASLRAVILAHPFMTMKTIFAIHWEALRIWMKGIPVYTHSEHRHDVLEESG